jgi:flagellar hook-associated protein 3 FlgL
MRVTNQMVSSSLLSNLNQLRRQSSTLVDQISSGSRISKVSDDPTAGAEVMRLQSKQESVKRWDANLSDAFEWVRTAEVALTQVTDRLHRARELAVAGTSSGLSDQNRADMAIEVDALLDDLVSTFDQQGPNGALFAGFQTDLGTGSPVFALDPLTGIVTYNGDVNAVQREVGPGVTVPVNITGDRLQTPADVLGTVWQLAQDLRKGPADGGSSALIGQLDQALGQVLSLRTENGSKEQRLLQVENRMKDLEIQLAAQMEKAQGVNMEKAIVDLQQAENTYMAALKVGGRIIPPSLVDFLR